VKVFDMTIEEIQHQIDAKKDPIAGSGSTGRGRAAADGRRG
jgi:hypothetical protein